MANVFQKAIDNFRDRLRIGANNDDMNIATDLEQQMVIRNQQEERALNDALEELSTGDTLEYDDYIGVSPEQKESLKKLNAIVRQYQSAYFVGSFNELNPVANVAFKREDVYANEHFKAELQELDQALSQSLKQDLTKKQTEKLHKNVQAMVDKVSKGEDLHAQIVNQPYGEIDDLLDQRERLQEEAQKEAHLLGVYMVDEFDVFKDSKPEAVVYSVDEVLDINHPMIHQENQLLKEAHQTFLQESPYYEAQQVQAMSAQEINEHFNRAAENVVESTARTAILVSKDLESDKEDVLLMQDMQESMDTRRHALRDTYLISRTLVSPKQAESVVRLLDEKTETEAFDVLAEAIRAGADMTSVAVPGMLTVAQVLEPVYDAMSQKDANVKRMDAMIAMNRAVQSRKIEGVYETEEERLLRQEQLEEDSPLKMPKL